MMNRAGGQTGRQAEEPGGGVGWGGEPVRDSQRLTHTHTQAQCVCVSPASLSRERGGRSIFTDTPPAIDAIHFGDEQTGLRSEGNVQPTHCSRTEEHRRKYAPFVSPSTTTPVPLAAAQRRSAPETKAAVKVNKRCLWIF